ncbi:uncharacterized protein LOC117326904 [Pecten maximus]|uniref:uncharacterized protein LOC117326904 n=1 Tax=Pecten maximus TaxID=6579 RepID=UPI0014584E52|nr:uncharacterized protein LOC117326904 [Pecten maximus]
MGLYRHTYSACYGITTENFIKASCPGDEKIVMDAVYAYAKPLSSGCPSTMISSVNASCCQHEEGDCGFEYDGFNKNTYYENCHGLNACYWTPVAWANAPCNASVYPPRTNYMEVSFYCISENEVKDVSEDGSVNTTTAILLNPGYVSGNNTGSLPANSSFRCSISASCATTLKIRALSLNFTKEGGICGQSLTISDGTNTQVLSCGSNTNFLPTDLQVANNTHYLEIQVNNTLSTDSGYFLLQIGDGNSNDPVTLGCGASVGEGRVAAEDLPECSNETASTDNSTIATTLSVPTTDSSGINSNRTMGQNHHTYSACYGTTTDSFIKASCPGDEKIVMDKIYAYAKPLSSGCPQTMTSSSNTSASCCQHEDGDCGFEYEGSNKNTYYQNCHALTACYWTPVAWANTPCNTSVYPPRTNYMEVSFFCISENEVKDVSEDGSVNTTTAILLNPGYVSGNDTGSLPANSSFKCSISASCAATLKIRTLSLNFTKEGGICGQSLTISDGTNTQVLSCDNNTNFLPTDLQVTNNTYYLEIQVNNTLGTDAGYFLLQIGDGNSNDPVTLGCGASVGGGRVAAKDLPECSNETASTDNSTITTTVSVPTTDSSGINSNRTMGKNRHTYSACYGTTTDSFIKASCPGDEKIVMDKIYAYAKPLSSGCPQTMTSSSNTSASCCQHDEWRLWIRV